MGKAESGKINYAIPGKAMDQQEFEQMIKKTESGPFHTIKAVKTEFKMESQALQVVISDMALISLEQIYEYGIETFAYTAQPFSLKNLFCILSNFL